MINYTHPQPEEGENPAYNAVRKREFSDSNKNNKQRKQVQKYLQRPDGCVIVNKYIEELFCSKRSFHLRYDFMLIEEILSKNKSLSGKIKRK